MRIEGGARIAGLLGVPGSANGAVRVTGARTTDGRKVEAELVVDALGRTSRVNAHRSLVVDGEPVATGIQPVGDALCHTNPTFALGASLSIAHGFGLAEVASTADDGRAVALAFESTAGADAAARFDAVSDEDRDRIRAWQGERIDIRDPGDSMALFLRLTAYPASARDPDLFRAVARRVNALDPPDALGKDEALVARALELAVDGSPAPSGPTRDELLERIASG